MVLREEAIKIVATISERKRRFDSLELEYQNLEDELKPTREAIQLAKKCLEESLAQKSYIEEIVSAGLTEVFAVPYTFVLETVLGDDNTIKGLRPRLKEADGELDDPLQSFGAGAQAIASVCFRIALLLLCPGTARVLVLDEPLANVSPALQARFQAFIETTCAATSLQVIMVTHMDQPFGKVYEVSKVGKKRKKSSVVVEIKE